jgi:glycosyltransferase involved in cell wall biosynthesis
MTASIIRVGVDARNLEVWQGGKRYLKNLILSQRKFLNSKIVFVQIYRNEDEINPLFDEHFRIDAKYNTLLFRILRNAILYLFNNDWIITSALKSSGIDILSHSYPLGKRATIKSICWIPDFQHYDMPEFFSIKERILRTLTYKNYIKNSNIVILSSAAMHDIAVKLYRNTKIEVLNFRVFLDEKDESLLKYEDKIRINKLREIGYYYYPAQLWTHKNHINIIEGYIKYRKNGGTRLLVLTGALNDYRNVSYLKIIKNLITNNNLEDFVLLFGEVHITFVRELFEHCDAILNFSKYEGWSTVLEESNCMGKIALVSPLKVFQEQDVGFFLYSKGFGASEIADTINEFEKNTQKIMDQKKDSKYIYSNYLQIMSKKYLDIVEYVNKFN